MNVNRGRWLIALALCTLLAIPASCGRGSSVLAETDQAQIYASVIRQLRHDQGGPSVGYIVGYTDDTAGTASGDSDSKVLPESLKEAVLTALAGTPGEYTWVSQFSEVPHDAYFSGESCQIILGNIRLQKDGSVHMAASLFYGGTGGGGTTYVLESRNGVWTVTGTTGPVWIS